MKPDPKSESQITFADAITFLVAQPPSSGAAIIRPEEDFMSHYQFIPNIDWVRALYAACPGDHFQCIDKATGKVRHYFRSPIPGMALDDLMAMARDDALFPPGTPRYVTHRFRVLMEWPREQILAAHALRTLR